MKVHILADDQEKFKSMIEVDAENWVTAPNEDGGYFVTCKNGTHQIINAGEELINIGDRFGAYTVVGFNYVPIKSVVYLELELAF